MKLTAQQKSAIEPPNQGIEKIVELGECDAGHVAVNAIEKAKEKIEKNDKEMTAELEAAKAATGRGAIVEFGYNDPNFKSVYYKTANGMSTSISFDNAYNALLFCRWIDAYFAD